MATRNYWMRVHRFFIHRYASCSSLNAELDLKIGWFPYLVDRFTLIWNTIIVITLIGRIYVLEPNGSGSGNGDSIQGDEYRAVINSNRQDDDYIIRDILILNYTFLYQDNGFIYCILTLIYDGIPFLWRLYLVYYRPTKRVGHDRQHMTPARELVKFYMFGPDEYEHPSEHKDSHDLDPRRSVLVRRPKTRSSWDHIIAITQTVNLLGNSPLLRLHEKPQVDNELERVVSTQFADKHWFKNPVKNINMETDHSYKRWRWLLKTTMLLSTFILSLGLLATSVSMFCLNEYSISLIMTSYNEENNLRTKVNKILTIYGITEVCYICIQVFLILSATDIFISLFYADLIYRSQSIESDLRDHLNYLLDRELEDGIIGGSKFREHPPEVRWLVRHHQLRLWSYFYYIDQLDNFISEYNIIHRILFIMCIAVGQGFLRTKDSMLKMGTASVIIGNFLSFTFVHVISWHIESRVSIIIIIIIII